MKIFFFLEDNFVKNVDCLGKTYLIQFNLVL